MTQDPQHPRQGHDPEQRVEQSDAPPAGQPWQSPPGYYYGPPPASGYYYGPPPGYLPPGSCPPLPPPPPPTRPTTSPNSIVAGSLGIAALLFTIIGSHELGILLALPALICAIVGLARNEPARGMAATGLILAILSFI